MKIIMVSLGSLMFFGGAIGHFFSSSLFGIAAQIGVCGGLIVGWSGIFD